MKGTPGHLPPIVLTGAPGAGKNTVAKLLTELAGYKACPREGKGGNACGFQPWLRAFVITDEEGMTRLCQARGFRVVWVYAPPSYRGQRLLAVGRLQPGADIPEDTSRTDYDHVIANIGSEDDLRHDVVELLNRLAS